MSHSRESVAVKKPVYRIVHLAVAAADAKEVIITGDFTGWAKEGVRFSPTAKGAWETTLELAPGEYQYRLLVDGRWHDHADAKKRIPNPFGTQNCVLEVK